MKISSLAVAAVDVKRTTFVMVNARNPRLEFRVSESSQDDLVARTNTSTGRLVRERGLKA